MVEFKRILAGADVALVGASQAEPFQMSDQRAVAATWLATGADPVKVRNLRQYRRKWRRNYPHVAQCWATYPPLAPIDSKHSIERTRIDNRDPLGAIAHMLLGISGAIARM